MENKKLHFDEITKKLSDFERGNDVSQFFVRGERVWPIVRSYIAWKAFNTETVGSLRTRNSRVWELFRTVRGGAQSLVSVMRNLSRDWLDRHISVRKVRNEAVAFKCDVLIAAQGNRTISWANNADFLPIVNPLVDALLDHSATCQVWLYGTLDAKRFQANCNDKVLWTLPPSRVLRTKEGPPLSQPTWFSGVAAWVESTFGCELPWSLIGGRIQQVLQEADKLAEILVEIECKTVLLQQWHSPRKMALALAASRVGIQVCDIQHGLQQAGHFAYMGWERDPGGGYGACPDTYLVWGQSVKDEGLNGNRNRSEEQYQVLGNLWLSMWREFPDPNCAQKILEARKLRIGHDRVVLVAMQAIEYLDDTLFDTIAQSPKNWLWIIRLHPKFRERADFVAEWLENTTHPNIILDKSANLPLYALLNACDLTVTWFSTCAIESLAFGVPAILLSESGANAFDRYIREGVMAKAFSPEEFAMQVDRLSHVSGKRCVAASANEFAPSSLTHKTLSRLLGKSNARPTL